MAIIKYILLFFLYSAGGWLFESLYRSLGEGKIINSGFLTGPMCPIYGTGALVMTVCLYEPFVEKSNRPLLVFLLGMVLCDAVEYVTSLLMEILFNQHWWNYEYEFLNIRGRICLKHTLFWGAASIGYTYLLHPFVNGIVSHFSDRTIVIIVCCALALFFIDWLHSFLKALDVRKMQAKFYAFREKVSQPIGKITDTIESATSTISEKLNENNSKINESRQELFEQARELILSFEEKLGLTDENGEKKTAKIRNRMYTNAKVKLNSLRELEWLKRIKEELKDENKH